MLSHATIGALVLLILSSLAKEYIPMIALTLALLSALHKTHVQQRRNVKLKDEYEGQHSINRTAAERHKASYLALQQRLPSVNSGNAACTRAHYEHPSAEIARENRQLKERLHQLRLGREIGRENTTCTRTHYDHSFAETTCANRVLKDRMQKLTTMTLSLRGDIERRNTTIKSLKRSVRTFHTTRGEQLERGAELVEALKHRIKTLGACNEYRYQEICALKEAASKAGVHVAEFERESRVLRARNRRRRGDLLSPRTESHKSEQTGNARVLPEDQAPGPGLRSISEEDEL